MTHVLDRTAIGGLITALRARGFTVIGPTEQGAAIVYDTIEGVDDLPEGRGDEHAPGGYRLRERSDRALFGYVVGPGGLKRFLHPPEVAVLTAARSNGGFRVEDPEPPSRLAFLGARPCDLAAVRVHDRVFVGDRFRDPVYEPRRRGSVFIAVNCTEPGTTCFCGSMGTGPRAHDGYDIVLTELLDEDDPWYLAESGSEFGDGLLSEIDGRPAGPDDLARAAEAMDAASSRMARSLDREAVREVLPRVLESDRWDEIARRCLTCANCTLVCPTCFCASVDDETSLDGETALRVRRWDSCFNEQFSYIHGGSLRPSPPARYRQWLTHKLSTWVDQFGVSGCVGCGRCITWCPAGIDLTAEAATFLEEVARV